MCLLSKPDAGWTDFCLGEQQYSLSYLTEIPVDWLDQAIHGLETLSPFVVHGFCEPGRFLCLVSYWNCHIIYECDDNTALGPDDSHRSTTHVNMLDFCKLLYKAINDNLEEWCAWGSHCGYSKEKMQQFCNAMREKLKIRLDRLRVLIEEKEDFFSEHSFFC